MLNFKTYFCSKCGWHLSDPLAMCLCSVQNKKCHEFFNYKIRCACKDKAYQIFILLVDIKNGPNVADA